MPDPLGYLRRQAIRRGVAGGSRAWLVVGGVAWGLRLLTRMAGTRRLRAVLTDELRPGESLLISHLPDQPRKAPPDSATRNAPSRSTG
ncbi:hypothetical protein [Candidatus Poriferisocius sp.]|uniref:hypothetical protein n=1 Tax=Candidatus Poriferisocius sp. TaxID=3101276 RepID=UPI003B027C0D